MELIDYLIYLSIWRNIEKHGLICWKKIKIKYIDDKQIKEKRRLLTPRKQML